MAAQGSWTNQVQNQVIVSGTNGGVFVYDPSPGKGNLIFSATDAAEDPYGNATLKGATGYSVSGGTYYAASMGPAFGGASVFGIWTASSAAGPYTFQGGMSADTSGDLTLGAVANLTLNTTGGSLRGQKDSSAVLGYLPLTQFDISTNAAGNDALVHNITKAWSIPAADALTGTTYTIKALAVANTGQTTAETLTIGANIDGVQTALATLGSAFNGGALNTAYAIPLELVMIVDAVTAGTPEVYLSGPLGDTAANRLATNSANMAGFTHTASFSGSAGGTFAIYAQWGGAGGSDQNVQTIVSRLYREGP